MRADRTIFDEPHFQSLELLAAQALAAGDFRTAFKYADRRCRILPLPEPHCFVLRAEASFHLKSRTDALDDIAKALTIAPDDIAANRRMLLWGVEREQLDAAVAVVQHDNNVKFLRQALDVLRRHGRRNFAAATTSADLIEGWAVWTGDQRLAIRIITGAEVTTTKFEADTSHELSDLGHACSFRVPRPLSATSQTVEIATGESVIHHVRAPANGTSRTMVRPQASLDRHRAGSVTVIVPIHGDYAATRTCLESLLDEIAQSEHRVVLIDDATPDRRISQYLITLGEIPGVEILVNARNLGFIGSVNRALARVPEGDFIILNADTIVPAGFIDRLVQAARSSSDIGTVTPLSNNGEFTSLPRPFIANPLLQRSEIELIDQIAATVNAGKIVDIPSGVGFCLYVRRACVEAVGTLSEEFGDGYLEDADFCLRAREAGWRNVCAPFIYVGHAGSRSFKNRKRSLVVRNLARLESRFPEHRRACGDFMATDPLRSARQGIEKAMPRTDRPDLLVTGSGPIAAIARKRGRNLVSTGRSALILEVESSSAARLWDIGGGFPQSLTFDLSRASERRSLRDHLDSIQPQRIEFLDPAGTPIVLAKSLLTLRVPYDLLIADAGLSGPKGKQFLAAAVGVAEPDRDDHQWTDDVCGPARFWRDAVKGARKLLAPSNEAKIFAEALLPGQTIHRVGGLAPAGNRVVPSTATLMPPHLGLVLVRGCTEEQWLARTIAEALGNLQHDPAITVIGAVPDDLQLMRATGLFVTGAVGEEDIARVGRLLALTHLFLLVTRPLFGHPVVSAAYATPLPVAYFDWSGRGTTANKKDLSIDPAVSPSELVAGLNTWLGCLMTGSAAACQ